MSKVGDMTVEMLQGLIHKTLESALANVATKENVNQFKDEMVALQMENKEMKRELNRLRAHIEYMDRESRQKKLIVRGLRDTTNVREAIKEVLETKLKVENPISIAKTTKIGSGGGKMSVMVECLSYNDTWQVLGKCRNLVGTTISIDRDLSVDEREQRRKLVFVKKEIEKIDSSKKITVRGNKMKIDKFYFSWKNDNFVCGTEEGIRKLNQLYGKDFSRITFDYTEAKYKRNEKLNNNKNSA